MTEAATHTVLIVDDEQAIVEALAEVLAWEGYTVHAAPGGRAALEVLRRTPVDVVLLDLMMPGLDGAQVAAAVRADPALHHLPIVLMSAAPIPVRDGVGWDATLHKPFELESLLQTLGAVIRKRRSPAAP